MRILSILAVTIAAIGCARQGSVPEARAPQPVAVDFGTSTPAAVHVSDVQVSPQTIQQAQRVKLTVRLDSANPKAMVRVNWFAPSGWSVFESKAPAKSEQMTFIAPAEIFRDSGRYRAEVLSGNMYQGEATVDVSG